MALSSDIIGTRCSTSANVERDGAPPTCWVGESGAMSSGWHSSSRGARGGARRRRCRGRSALSCCSTRGCTGGSARPECSTRSMGSSARSSSPARREPRRRSEGADPRSGATRGWPAPGRARRRIGLRTAGSRQPTRWGDDRSLAEQHRVRPPGQLHPAGRESLPQPIGGRAERLVDGHGSPGDRARRSRGTRPISTAAVSSCALTGAPNTSMPLRMRPAQSARPFTWTPILDRPADRSRPAPRCG